MNYFLLFLGWVIVVGIIFWFIEQKNRKAKDTLQLLDALGDPIGRSINSLSGIMGEPEVAEVVDSKLVRWVWMIGKVSVVAEWDKMDRNNSIVSFMRSDRISRY